MTPDRRVAPGVAERTGNAVPVQIGRDCTRRFSYRKFPEDASDNRGLGLIDISFAPNRLALAVDALHHVVAIAEPATCLAPLYPSAQTTVGLGGEVFQEQSVHRAFEADVKLRDFAFGQGNNLYAGKAQMLEQRRYISLIARDAVQCLGEYDIELATLSLLPGLNGAVQLPRTFKTRRTGFAQNPSPRRGKCPLRSFQAFGGPACPCRHCHGNGDLPFPSALIQPYPANRVSIVPKDVVVFDIGPCRTCIECNRLGHDCA